MSFPDPSQMTPVQKAELDALRADFPAWSFGLECLTDPPRWDCRLQHRALPGCGVISIDTTSAEAIREALVAVEEIYARHAKEG